MSFISFISLGAFFGGGIAFLYRGKSRLKKILSFLFFGTLFGASCTFGELFFFQYLLELPRVFSNFFFKPWHHSSLPYTIFSFLLGSVFLFLGIWRYKWKKKHLPVYKNEEIVEREGENLLQNQKKKIFFSLLYAVLLGVFVQAIFQIAWERSDVYEYEIFDSPMSCTQSWAIACDPDFEDIDFNFARNLLFLLYLGPFSFFVAFLSALFAFGLFWMFWRKNPISSVLSKFFPLFFFSAFFTHFLLILAFMEHFFLYFFIFILPALLFLAFFWEKRIRSSSFSLTAPIIFFLFSLLLFSFSRLFDALFSNEFYGTGVFCLYFFWGSILWLAILCFIFSLWTPFFPKK